MRQPSPYLWGLDCSRSSILSIQNSSSSSTQCEMTTVTKSPAGLGSILSLVPIPHIEAMSYILIGSSFQKSKQCSWHFSKTCREIPLQQNLGNSTVVCKLCKSYFSVSHGGNTTAVQKWHSTSFSQETCGSKINFMEKFLLNPKHDSQTDKVRAAKITGAIVSERVHCSTSNHRSADCISRLGLFNFSNCKRK